MKAEIGDNPLHNVGRMSLLPQSLSNVTAEHLRQDRSPDSRDQSVAINRSTPKRNPMKRHSPVHSYFVPFMLWTDLGFKTLETMFAAAQVIGHRTTRIAIAGHAPNARDRREFALMGQEKMEAGAKSAQAMAAHMLTMTQPWGALAYRDFLRNSAALMSLASSRTLSQLLARQAALALTLGQSAANMADTSKTVTRLAHRGLKPIHAKVVANAKRLGRH
jgi:hypothetical protein